MATLDDIKAVLEGIRADLGGGGTSPTAGMSPRDMEDYVDAVKAHTEALERQTEAAERAAAAGRDLDEVEGSLSESFENLSSRMGSSEGMLGKFASAGKMLTGVFEGLKMAGAEVAKMSFEHALAMDKATSAMRANTGAAEQVASAMRNVIDANIRFGITASEAQRAATSLYETLFDFASLSERIQESLISDATILAEVGLEFRSFSDIAQLATKQLGMSIDETSDLTYQLRAAAQDIGMPIDEFARKVVPLSENLASMGDNALQSAADVLKMHRETGIAVDTFEKLDQQMYTFEGATRFAQGMNQALQGNFFNPHVLMKAFDEGPGEVARLVQSTLAQAGRSFDDMERRERIFLSKRMGIGEADLAKLMQNEIKAGGLAFEEAASARATAQEDAMINMKSTEEYTQNMKNALLTLPMGPVVEEMRSMTKATHQSAVNALDFADNLKSAFVEAHKTKLALLTIGTIIAKQNEGGFGEGMLTALFAALAVGRKAIVAGSKAAVGAVSKMAYNAYYAVWSGAVDFFAGSFISQLGTVAGYATFIYSTYEAIGETYDGITNVLKSGGDYLDQLTAVPITVGKGFATALDNISSGFGLLEEGMLSRLSRLFNPGGKSFLEAYVEIDWSYLWEGLVESFRGPINDFVEFGEYIIEMWNKVFGIQSPSTVMMEIGTNMVDGLLMPFNALGSLLQPMMDSVIDIIPEPIRDMFAGGDNLGSISAAAATTNAETISSAVDAMTNRESGQTIEVSFQLDGREVDKKILNVVGGIVQPLTA